jgi:hypothetical protein
MTIARSDGCPVASREQLPSVSKPVAVAGDTLNAGPRVSGDKRRSPGGLQLTLILGETSDKRLRRDPENPGHRVEGQLRGPSASRTFEAPDAEEAAASLQDPPVEEANADDEANAAKQVRVSDGRKRRRSTPVDLEPEVEPVDPDEEVEPVDPDVEGDNIDPDDYSDDDEVVPYVLSPRPNAEWIMVDMRPEDMPQTRVLHDARRCLVFPARTLWTPITPRILNPRKCKDMALDWKCGYW